MIWASWWTIWATPEGKRRQVVRGHQHHHHRSAGVATESVGEALNVVFPIRRVVNATKANADFAAAYEPILEAYEPQLPRALCRLLRPSPASGGTVPEPKEALSYLMGQLQQRREEKKYRDLKFTWVERDRYSENHLKAYFHQASNFSRCLRRAAGNEEACESVYPPSIRALERHAQASKQLCERWHYRNATVMRRLTARGRNRVKGVPSSSTTTMTTSIIATTVVAPPGKRLWPGRVVSTSLTAPRAAVCLVGSPRTMMRSDQQRALRYNFLAAWGIDVS
jgi:hypothetical protein